MKNEKRKKQKQKIFTQPITKNCKKDRESIIEIFLKMRKLKKENKSMLKTEKKASQMKLEHDKKEYMRNYYHKKCVKSFN